MMIGLRLEVKNAFFSDEKVIRATDANTRRTLIRVGGRIRKTMQYSMRPGRGKTSPTGSPPYTHKKKLLKRQLYFAWDSQNKSVVVGPVLLQKTRNEKIPELLDKGGTQVTRELDGRLVVKQYGGNPFSVPALVQNQGFITEAFDKTRTVRDV